MSDVTRILQAIERGENKATDELLPIVYRELKLLARQLLRRERHGQTLQATALVHEAYIRLVASDNPEWQGRRHFFAAAAEAMRRILVDVARRKRSLQHGGGRQRVDIDIDAVASIGQGDSADLIALDEALTKLATQHEAEAELVKIRFFAGLTVEEAARSLGISATTAKRRWRYARAWLYREVGQRGTEASD